MVNTKVEEEHHVLVYGIRLSSVGPGRSTGSDVVHDLSGMDIAMKLHYVKGVYFFSSQAAQGLTIARIKESLFHLFCEYYYSCGRLRRTESGRPYIKCNDCGARFIEAQCDKTVHEWLQMKDSSVQKLLVSQQVIGPDLSFSPTTLIQVTHFKCGGISLGLSWAHVLGDALSASNFINKCGQIIASIGSINMQPNFHSSSGTSFKHQISKSPAPPLSHGPLSVKQVDPVGDHWITANSCEMDTFSFHVTAAQLATLQSEISGQNQTEKMPIFESLCAIIWHSIAKVRRGSIQAEIVTTCKNDPSAKLAINGIVTNTQIISTVKADFPIAETDPKRLVNLLVNEAADERREIEELVEKDNGLSDFIVYGARLTFVDLEEVDLYGFELNGHKPEFVYYTVQGVGDEGAVFVLPAGPKGADEGRIVTITLPENQVPELKVELVKNGLGGHDLA
ncbi:protein ECERIFERUM 26-like [Juglans microcarpa x Juglans regia]|uniref:protein ECERIFERUM 26-like n=1 Tax=Juglans microcarpa x Juglans regia TaxID=2249226 RepID=UPI001B7E70C4|nr:protein ECERIFERUM 26-like [Juglans microcarpa x Juglans regia]